MDTITTPKITADALVEKLTTPEPVSVFDHLRSEVAAANARKGRKAEGPHEQIVTDFIAAGYSAGAYDLPDHADDDERERLRRNYLQNLKRAAKTIGEGALIVRKVNDTVFIFNRDKLSEDEKDDLRKMNVLHL